MWFVLLVFETHPDREDDQVNILCLNYTTPEAVNLLNFAKLSFGSVAIYLNSKMINKMKNIKVLLLILIGIFIFSS